MKIAINGFGRIGRLVFRLMENTDLEVLCAYIYNEIYKGDNI